MLVLLTILDRICGQYLKSLERDLGNMGFNMALMVMILSWAGIIIIAGMLILGSFHMPSDPLFYANWFGVTLIAEFTLALTLAGLLNTTFFAANGFQNIGFAITALYAGLFLHETFTAIQIAAIIVAVLGSLLFFKRGGVKNYFQENKGIFLILFSLLLHPLGSIFYKAATFHTDSYSQFLTGRLVMDLVFYTLFSLIVYAVWYRKNPIPAVLSFFNSRTGIYFTVGSTLVNLLGSWLIFKIPISLFTVLSTVSIPTAYFIGSWKYKEPLVWRHILGSLFIVLGVILFLIK